MRNHFPWLIWSTTLLLIVVGAAVAHERGQGTVAQTGDAYAVPTIVDEAGNATAVELPYVMPTIEEIVIPTLAPGEPTPDFSLPVDASLDVEGVPALAPREDTGAPEFTIAEVEAYLADEPHLYADPQYAPPEIVSLNVMTAKEATYVILSPIYRPDDAPVLMVEFQGHFYVNGPVGHALTGQSSYMVFDAQTGNMLTVAVGE